MRTNIVSSLAAPKQGRLWHVRRNEARCSERVTDDDQCRNQKARNDRAASTRRPEYKAEYCTQTREPSCRSRQTVARRSSPSHRNAVRNAIAAKNRFHCRDQALAKVAICVNVAIAPRITPIASAAPSLRTGACPDVRSAAGRSG